MRAALAEQVDHPLDVVDDVELDPPRSGELQVRIAYAGLCHSDLSYIQGRIPARFPLLLGHEVSGTVEAVGPDVDIAIGTPVVLSLRPPCRRCYWCVRGEVELCAPATAMLDGTYPDGETRLRHRGRTVYRGIVLAGFAESTVVPVSAAVPVPPETDLATACIVGCSVMTGVGAVLNVAKVEPGATVMVVGLGGVGIAIVQGARIAGAGRIIGVDTSPEQLERARSFGVTDVVDPREQPIHKAARALTNGIGVDYGFDAVGNVSIIEGLMRGIRNGGTTVSVGLPRADEMVTTSGLGLNINERKLVGCYLGAGDPWRDYSRLLSLASSGALNLDAMVTSRRPLHEINEALDDMRSARGIRTIVEMR